MSETTKKDTPKSTTGKKDKGFSAEEKAAMKERAREMKSAATKAEAEKAVLEKIDELAEPERTVAKRIHEIIKENAPTLSPKLWYGMPAYALDEKILCFFQSAQKFNTRYATLGFNDIAKLDDGDVFPVAFAVMSLGAAEEKKIRDLVKKAVS